MKDTIDEMKDTIDAMGLRIEKMSQKSAELSKVLERIRRKYSVHSVQTVDGERCGHCSGIVINGKCTECSYEEYNK